jgi:hypothetical protein
MAVERQNRRRNQLRLVMLQIGRALAALISGLVSVKPFLTE